MLSRLCCLFLLPFFAVALIAQDPVEDALAKLSLEHKAGQLFMSWSLSRAEGNNHEQMMSWVEEVGLGGVILSLGTVEDAATLIPKLQAKAKVPLLLAGDFEGGVWWRLKGATELGNQMLVGATGSEELAEAMGRVTGLEAKALGFHWVFAPVLDVNSNPANPIINVRSFGEDPEMVARLGPAFARGVRSQGLLSCGKHFPGHGDVDSDSHLELPTVPGDRERLHRVELRPFRAAAADGLESVMTGHLAVPGLGEDPSVPATLSHKILHDVLRNELGFTGLVVTDALEMGGVKNAFAPGEVAVRALLAGADVLLMPPDPLAARQAVVDAVQAGRVPMARLDDAVRRILQAKQKVGLIAGGGRVQPNWKEQMQRPESVAVAERIASEGLVLVRDRDRALHKLSTVGKALLVTLVDKEEGQGKAFAEAMAGTCAGDELRLSGASTEADLLAAIKRIGEEPRIVVSLFMKVREYSGGIGLPPRLHRFGQALQDAQSVTAVSFGNPYLVRNLPGVDAYIAAFDGTDIVQRAAAQALLGKARIAGRLPVTIPGVAMAGHGLTRNWAVREQDASETELARSLEVRLQRAVADHAFPGAVCLVARRGELAASVVVGKQTYAADSASVDRNTLYDLASLTKVCTTTPAILRLVQSGKLSLDDPIQKWLPKFQGAGKGGVTVRHLLAHQGGLSSYVRYFRTLKGKQAIVDATLREGLMSEPGTGVRYSDLGFITLMALVEAVSGTSFDSFVQQQVLTPFGMHGALFQPSAALRARCAPTERDDQRGGIMRGFVHDENAYAMGGVSGHAGLFAAADDVLSYGVTLLAGGSDVLSRDLIDLATKPAGITQDTTRGLGFQLLKSGGYGGTDIPAGTFGHTGFTGTSLWCCPRYNVCVVLLTNRVHPTRVNNKITAVRRAVHDLVLESLR